MKKYFYIICVLVVAAGATAAFIKNDQTGWPIVITWILAAALVTLGFLQLRK